MIRYELCHQMLQIMINISITVTQYHHMSHVQDMTSLTYLMVKFDTKLYKFLKIIVTCCTAGSMLILFMLLTPAG